MTLKPLHPLILALFITSLGYSAQNDRNRDTRLYENGAEGIYDGSLHVTGASRTDKFFELVAKSAITLPATNHAKIYLSSTTEQLCVAFDNASTSCLGSSVGTITGVTAGLGLVGGGSSGNVTVNLSTPISNSFLDVSSITKQGNTFNGNGQLVRTNSSGQIVDTLLTSNVSLLASTQTRTATETFTSSVTFQGQINISTSVLLNGVSGTTGQVLTTGGAGTTPFWTTPASGTSKYLQVVSSATQIATVTTSSSYQSTNLVKSITLAGTTSDVKISVSCGGQIGATLNTEMAVTIFRGNSDLESTGTGFNRLRNQVASTKRENVSFVYLDAPLMSGTTTYTVKIKNNDNTTSIQLPSADLELCSLILEEITVP